MKIKGSIETGNINELTLKHKGLEVKFRKVQSGEDYLVETDTTIIFGDIYEIDQFIDILKSFKKEIQYRYDGGWKAEMKL